MWQYVNTGETPIFSFNPHTHEGCDNIVSRFCRCNFGVSIHTPTKGVTDWTPLFYIYMLMFQSTHPRRVWLMTTVGAAYKMLFQSTHPRRVWLRDGNLSSITIKFQSTHPRRVWLLAKDIDLARSKFQSTHPRRVWLVLLSRRKPTRYVSIHTPTKGVTSC